MEFIYIVNQNNKIIGEFLLDANHRGDVIKIPKYREITFTPNGEVSNIPDREHYTFKFENVCFQNSYDLDFEKTFRCIRTDFATAQEIMKTLN